MIVWGKTLSCVANRLNGGISVAVFLMVISTALSGLANAADYMPPPLFGGPATVTVTPPTEQKAPVVTPVTRNQSAESPATSPIPNTPTLPVPRIADDPTDKIIVPTPPPGVKGDIPLPPNVLERDAIMSPMTQNKTGPAKTPQVTVDTSTSSKPLETDDLINHPANYIDPLAKKSEGIPSSEPSVMLEAPLPVVDKAVPTTMSSTSTRKTPAGLARPIVDGPGVKNIRPKEARKKTVPVMPLPESKPVDSGPSASDITLIDQAPDRTVTTSEMTTPQGKTLEDANKDNPTEPVPSPKTVTKPGIKSPSPTVRKIIEQNPKVMVYSRDKQTGEFKRVENSEHRVLSNKGQKTTLSTPKNSDIPPPAFIDDVMDTAQKLKAVEPKKSVGTIRPATPPLPAPVSPLSMNDALNGRLVPLTEDDLNRAIISMAPEKPFGKVPNAPIIPPAPKNDMLYATKMNDVVSPTASDKPSLPLSIKNPGHDLSTATPVAEKKMISTTPPSSSLPPTSTDGPATIIFGSGEIELSSIQRGQIDDTALIPLSKNKNSRIYIRSYASPIENEQNSDRRIALARGLAVREYLKNQGITSDRIDLKILGSPVDQTPSDRVELIIR